MRRARAGGQCARREHERERAREIRARRPAPIGDEETLLASRGRRGVCCVPATDEGVRLPPFESPSGAPAEARRAEPRRSIDRVGPTGLVVYESRPVIVQNETKEEKNRPTRSTDRSTVRRIDRPTDRRAPAIDPNPSELSR